MPHKKKKDDHIHKYQRMKWGKSGTLIWRCMLPGCSHYVHEPMIRNRYSLCWKCLQPFLMNPEKLLRVKPKCDKCQHGGDRVLTKLDELLSNL